MMAEQAEEGIDQASQYANPCREKMQIPAPARMADHERNRKIDQRGTSQGSCITPIEARMGNENLDSAVKQTNETKRRDPVGYANDRGVPRRILVFRDLDGQVWEGRCPR